MATRDIITARVSYNAAALATMGTCPTWDAAMTRFLSAVALADADTEYGESAAQTEIRAREDIRLAAKYGPGWRNIPAARAEADRNLPPILDAETAWTETFCEPVWQSARALALVPAPTLAATLFKAQMLDDQELWNDAQFTHNCMAIVQADFARLADQTDEADADLLAAWERRKVAYRTYNAAPLTDDEPHDPVTKMTPEEAAFWQETDAIEATIEATTAKTLAGIKAQLWCAVSHMVTHRPEDNAANEGDLAAMSELHEGLDWNVKLVVAAIRGLEAMEA